MCYHRCGSLYRELRASLERDPLYFRVFHLGETPVWLTVWDNSSAITSCSACSGLLVAPGGAYAGLA
jgi:hypothetical protein